MRHVGWLLGSSLLVAGAAQAQVGVRAGANVSVLTEHNSRNAFAASVTGNVGYQVGVFDELPLGRHWALVPEVQFSRESQFVRKEGAAHSYYYINDGTYLIHDYRVGFSYLNLPVLLRRRLGPLYLEAGPQGSVLLGGRGVGETRHVQLSPYGHPYAAPEPISQAATAYYNRFDAGACVGVGMQLPAGWGAAVRGYWGLTALTGDPRDYQYQAGVLPAAGTQYRRTFQASLTYQPFAGTGRQPLL